MISKYDEKRDFLKVDISSLKSKLQNTMWDNVGIYRDEKSLNRALADIEQMCKEFHRDYKCLSKDEYELRNMLITASLIVKSALNRKESRGAHYRTDYLETSEDCEHSLIKKEKGEISFAK